MELWLYLLLLTPLLGFLTFTFLKPAATPLLATVFSGLSWVGALGLCVSPSVSGNVVWLDTGGFVLHFSVSVDRYAALMLPLVSGISLLVQLFSTRYMGDDPQRARYFGYLQLFTLAMLGVVLADDLLSLFFCWELVGLSSYLLIGFWQTKKHTGAAALKAFLFNRIGDIGFLIALFALLGEFATLRFAELEAGVAGGDFDPVSLQVAGFGLLLACMGKSAQFPLSAWLPDAMAGPTPASALIHAATMVAAGVFLLVRTSFLLPETVLLTTAWIGAFTALLGALLAMNTFDFKKVLAGSTISQLGYMVLAVGVGAPHAALFHLTTHAFFKAGLFLTAGAVIHQFHHIPGLEKLQSERFPDAHAPEAAQDMRLMGGLRHYLPWVFGTYTVFAAALMGLPLFSGFLSKDAILLSLWHHAEGLYFLPAALAFLGVFLTAYYAGRQWFGVFFGTPFLPPERLAALPATPTAFRVPLLLLALGSLGFAFAPLPWEAASGWFVQQFPLSVPHEAAVAVGAISVGLAAGGLGLSFVLFAKRPFGSPYYGLEDAEQALTSRLSNVATGGATHLADTEKQHAALDLLVHYVLVRPYLWLCRLLTRLDQTALDKLLVRFAESVLVIGHINAWTDRNLVDGGARSTSWLVRQGGQLFRGGVHGGRIQGYLAAMLLGLLLLLIFIR